MLQILKKILDFFLDTKWDTEQYQILSQIPKSFADTKSSISDTKMATLALTKLSVTKLGQTLNLYAVNHRNFSQIDSVNYVETFKLFDSVS